jgi:hypothetical protein
MMMEDRGNDDGVRKSRDSVTFSCGEAPSEINNNNNSNSCGRGRLEDAAAEDCGGSPTDDCVKATSLLKSDRQGWAEETRSVIRTEEGDCDV